MLHSALLAASRSKALQAFSMDFPLAKRVSRRFVAGETLDEAIEVAKGLNAAGMLVSLDHLGENVTKKEEAKRAAMEYLAALDAIGDHELNCNISIKLTQLALDIDLMLCEELVRKIAARAKKVGTTVRLDMESSAYTQDTLDLYRKLCKKHENIGVVIQSYLYRSEQDLRALISQGANVRLCKGAYKEPKKVAFPLKMDVDRNYKILLEKLFSEEARKQGVVPCIATHDSKMIHGALRIIKAKRIPSEEFEFQMLYGIRPELQHLLASEGYQVRVYVPYGEPWYPYLMRRLAERPANIWFLAKNLLRA